MKKTISLILVLVLCLSLCACSDTTTAAPKSTKPTVESLYTDLVNYAKKGEYQNAKRLYISNNSLEEYKDAADYYQYCVVVDGYYNKGRIGYTYRELSKISKILDVADILAKIEKKIKPLEGEWKTDNKAGSYLYLAIKDGYLANDVVGYTNADKGFVYTDSDFLYEIVEHTYSDGTVGLAVSDNYALTYFEDEQQIMLVKFAEAEFNTFNGLYDKIK